MVPPPSSIPERSAPAWDEPISGEPTREWIPAIDDVFWDLPKVSLNVGPIPADVAASMVADLAGVGLIVPADGSGANVVISGVDVPAERLFRTIAQSAGWRVEYVDGLVRFFSDAKDTGGDVIVSLPSGYLDAAEIIDGMNAVVANPRAKRVGDRVIVSVDGPDVAKLRRWVSLAFAAPSAWVVDVRVVTLTRSAFREIGLSGRAELDADAAAFLNAGPANGGASAALAGAIGARLAGSIASGQFSGRLESDSTLYLVEGRSGTLTAGQSIPVPRRSISSEGTVSDVGYDTVRSGFSLRAELQAVEAGALLKIDAELSDVVGLVAGTYPQLATRSTSSEVVVRSGDWVVVTGLGEVSTSDDRSGLFLSTDLGADTSRVERRTLVILLRATRLPSATLRGGDGGDRGGGASAPPSGSPASATLEGRESTPTNKPVPVPSASDGGSMRSTTPATESSPLPTPPNSAAFLPEESAN